VKEPVVTDSTCLIGLERIGQLDILPALFEPILIPPEVQREFGISFPWLTVEPPADQALVTVLKMLVDDGEAEAIALAHGRGWRIILDDRRARSVGKHLGVTIIGTVGVLVRAKRQGIIASLKTLLSELEAHEFYIGAALKEEALRLINELDDPPRSGE
jgi:predicted nucleic acid-binding protein